MEGFLEELSYYLKPKRGLTFLNFKMEWVRPMHLDGDRSQDVSVVPIPQERGWRQVVRFWFALCLWHLQFLDRASFRVSKDKG